MISTFIRWTLWYQLDKALLTQVLVRLSLLSLAGQGGTNSTTTLTIILTNDEAFVAVT